jgi:hypothetical protein
MLETFLMAHGLDADDIAMLGILSVAFMPSIVGLTLALFASLLPEDGDAVPQPSADLQNEHQAARDRADDWRRAA